MGTSISNALFDPVQQRVLGLLFGQPDREFQSTELIRLVRGGSGAVHRQLIRLSEAGLVTVTRRSNHKFYQANRATPVFSELTGLVNKTIGIPARIRAALAPLSDRIVAAAVFGSVAKGSESSKSDVDVLVLSDQITHAELFEALQDAERELGRPVNPTLLEPQAWRARLQVRDSFVQRLTAGPMLPIIGSVADVR